MRREFRLDWMRRAGRLGSRSPALTDLGERQEGTMRIGRVVILPAVAALSVAGTILAAPAMAAPTSHTTVYLHQSGVGGGYVYLHQ